MICDVCKNKQRRVDPNDGESEYFCPCCKNRKDRKEYRDKIESQFPDVDEF